MPDSGYELLLQRLYSRPKELIVGPRKRLWRIEDQSVPAGAFSSFLEATQSTGLGVSSSGPMSADDVLKGAQDAYLIERCFVDIEAAPGNPAALTAPVLVQDVAAYLVTQQSRFTGIGATRNSPAAAIGMSPTGAVGVPVTRFELIDQPQLLTAVDLGLMVSANTAVAASLVPLPLTAQPLTAFFFMSYNNTDPANILPVVHCCYLFYRVVHGLQDPG